MRASLNSVLMKHIYIISLSRQVLRAQLAIQVHGIFGVAADADRWGCRRTDTQRIVNSR